MVDITLGVLVIKDPVSNHVRVSEVQFVEMVDQSSAKETLAVFTIELLGFGVFVIDMNL